MNKRLICLILSAIFTLCPISTYAADTNTSDESRFELLQGLGIICGVPYDENTLAKDITKSSFINFVVNIAKDSGYTDYYDEKSLQEAEELGLIVSSKDVGENDKLSTNEAVTIAVRLLGYELDAQNSGGYPGGYLSVGNSNGLLDGVESDDTLDYATAAKLLYNITEADCSAYKLTSTGALVNYSKQVNSLEYYRNIYTVEGIVTENGESGLYGDTTISDGYVKIGKETYESGELNASELLGRKVKAYIKNTGEPTDVIVYALDKTENILIVEAENVEAFENNLTVLRYYRDEISTKQLSAKVLPSAVFMLNGVAYAGCSESDLKKEGTKTTLIDTDSDGVYDFVSIESYDTMIVEMVSTGLQKIYNQYTFDSELDELDLSDFHNTDVTIIKNGQESQLSDIAAGDVLSIYKTPKKSDGKIKIYVETNSFEGRVNSYSEADKEVIIGGKNYEVSDLYLAARAKGENAAQKIEAGGEFVFRMDRDGKIVSVVRKASDDVIYAYPIDFFYDNDSGDKVYYLRIFTEEGTWKKSRLAEKVSVNGKTYEHEYADTDSVITNCVQTDIIGIKFNQSGEVNYIQTPEQYYAGMDSSKFNKDTGVNGKTFRYNDSTFSNYYYMTGNTKVFIVPDADTNNKSLYRIGNNYSFKSNNVPVGTVTGYNRDEFYMLDMVLWKSTAANIRTTGTTLYMIKKKGVRVNDANEVVPYVNVASETYAGVTFDGISGAFDSVDVGDLVKIHINSEGAIDNCDLFYDVSSGDFTGKTISGSLGGEDYAVQGEVLKKDPSGGMLLIDSTQELAFKLAASKSVLIYNNATGDVTIGTINDIENDDFVVVNLIKNQTSVVAVYKEMQ